MTIKPPQVMEKLAPPYAAGKMVYLTPEEALEIRVYISELQLSNVDIRRNFVAALARLAEQVEAQP